MNRYALPAVDTSVLVTLPEPYGRPGFPTHYRVVDARNRQLTLRLQARSGEPSPPAGTPCLVGSVLDGGRSSCEAVVVACGGPVLILDVARDPREHPRCRRPCKVRVEVPYADIEVVEGIMEDISAGGVGVHVPVMLPIDQRVFVTMVLSGTQPIVAIAEVREVHHGDGPDDLVARMKFTVMAPSHRARLDALLEWPVEETSYAEDIDLRSQQPVSAAT